MLTVIWLAACGVSALAGFLLSCLFTMNREADLMARFEQKCLECKYRHS